MWLRLDDGFATHPKILTAGHEALAVQIRAICYASQHKTDGFIPLQAVHLFTSDIARQPPEGWATFMVGSGLWEIVENGYTIHDYLQWNMSKEAYLEMKLKLSKAGKKGMKSRWKRANQPYNQPYKAPNKVSDNLPHNKSITQQSTSTLVLNHLNPEGDKKEKKEGKEGNGRDYREEAKEVLAFLNLKAGKQFRENDTNLDFIIARLKSGVTLDVCRTMIMRKVRDWLTDPKMKTFLRPETLFNKTKFETYLADVTP